MRLPIIKRYSAVGKTATDGKIVIPVNYLQLGFILSVAILRSQDAANDAATVQFTYDDLSDDWLRPVTISQAATVITVTDPDLPNRGGVAVGDAVKLTGSGNSTVEGEFVVASITSPTAYTLTSPTNQALTTVANVRAGIYRLFSSTIIQAANRVFGNLSAGISQNNSPTAAAPPGPIASTPSSGAVTGVVLNVTAITAGSVYLQLLQGLGY